MHAQVALADNMSTSAFPRVFTESRDELTQTTRTETKALTVYPCSELFAILPKHLHPSIRSSKYYTANSDAWTFQAQTQRSRTANADDNRRKLTEEVMRIYHELTPNETSSDKKEKHRKM